MYCPSANSSVDEASSRGTATCDRPLQPYDNYLQHRSERPEQVQAGRAAVEEHRLQLEAAAAHKANSSDRFLQSAEEKEAMGRAAAVRDALRVASEKRTENARTVMEEAARTRARNIDTTQSNNGCAEIWDFGCPVDIFQAACDGDVDMLFNNLQAAEAIVKAAVEATGFVPEEPTEGPTDVEEEQREENSRRALAQARAEAIASSPRVALAANLINALGQPSVTRYKGVQFEKRWTFQAPPLALAAAFNRERAVKALLGWGANPMQTSSTGMTALGYAQQRGYDVIAAMLEDAMKHEQVDSSALLELTPVSNTM